MASAFLTGINEELIRKPSAFEQPKSPIKVGWFDPGKRQLVSLP